MNMVLYQAASLANESRLLAELKVYNNPAADVRTIFLALFAFMKKVNMDKIEWKDIKADLGRPLNFAEVDLINLSAN